MPGTVFTVGHGTRSAEELVEILNTAGVAVLVDVRRFPASRRHPRFGREEMERWLSATGVDYVWQGEELGGRRKPAGDATRHPAWRNAAFQGYADHTDSAIFRSAIEDLERKSTSSPMAILCAETLWWRCHRRLIADTLELRGTKVVHLITPGNSQPHPVNPAARLGADGWPVYDLGETTSLSLET
jgi:uncharacterized protein (DUF488 family)